VEDALSAAEAGADAIGLNFFRGSKRAVSIALAKTIAESVPPFVTVVGLFVNHGRDEVEDVLQQIPLDLLQFHGDETPDFCSWFARPYLKTLRMKPDTDPLRDGHRYEGARGLLLDAWDDKQYGGTGKTFDWKQLENNASGARIVLAGGLTPDNVAQAITTARPWAVDVSSGVETAPGVKSAQLIRSFISEVNRV
jgi:phosphoribosylanthranilate isomerase